MSSKIGYQLGLAVAIAVIMTLTSCGSDDVAGPVLPEVETDLAFSGYVGTVEPILVRGDCEFADSSVWVILDVFIDAEPESLVCYFYMGAHELSWDWTVGRDLLEKTLYRAPEGWEITRIVGPESCHHEYMDMSYLSDTHNDGGFTFITEGTVYGRDFRGCSGTFVGPINSELHLDSLYIERARL